MNLSLKNRVATSFIIANLVVLVLSFTVFHFLNSLNKEIEGITDRSNQVSLLTDEIRISAVSVLKYQRRILSDKSPELVERIVSLCDSFTSQLQRLENHYNDPEVKKVVGKMLNSVDLLKSFMSKGNVFSRDTIGLANIGELADKILESFSELQEIQYNQGLNRDKEIKKIINETKRNMMITLIIGFLGTIILGLVVPGKIALPFKKIKDAIRELQDCNFDVRIYYNQDDEIGEIAREMNKMILSFKVFDELRADRISVENRKFDALANLVGKPVLVASADAKLMYMNNKLYSLLQVSTDDVIGKTMSDAVIPKTIIESFELAIKRRSKIENAEIIIPARRLEAENADLEVVDVIEVVSPNETGSIEVQEVVFTGYANVIPVRGKDSSLDYYLMVLSTDVF